MRFRSIMTATVLAVLAISFVVRTPGIAQDKTKQGAPAKGTVSDIVSGAIGGVFVALVEGIVGIATGVFEAPKDRHKQTKPAKAR